MIATFYNLNLATEEVRDFFLCELIEKLYRQEKTVLVWCESREQAERLDEALWQFKEESFIPHNLEGEGPTPLPPVHLVYNTLPKARFSHLLNLTENLPANSKQFQELVMIVEDNEEKKKKLRLHYRTLQNLGFTVNYKQAPDVTNN